MIALKRFAKQHEVIAAAHSWLGVAALLAVASVGFLAAFMAAAFGYVNFAANDGLDVALAGLVEKIGSGEKIAVVGDGHGGHFLARCFIQKLGGFASPVEQTVIRMNVEMHELRLPHGTPF